LPTRKGRRNRVHLQVMWLRLDIARVAPNRNLSVQLRQAIRGGGFAKYQIAHVISLKLGNVDVDLRLDTVQPKLVENAGLMDIQRRRARVFNADAQPSEGLGSIEAG
jgi:hypothetical protein